MITETVIAFDLLMIALIILALIYSTSNKVNFSVLVAVIITIGADSMTMVIMDYVMKVSDLHLLNFLWFTGYAAAHVITAYSILYVHINFGLMISKCAKVTIAVLMALSFIQLITYFDHAHFKTGVLSNAYQIIIPGIELIYSSCLALFLLRELLRTNPLERYMN